MILQRLLLRGNGGEGDSVALVMREIRDLDKTSSGCRAVVVNDGAALAIPVGFELVLEFRQSDGRAVEIQRGVGACGNGDDVRAIKTGET